MGADGGSIVGRAELVKTKAKVVRHHSEKEIQRDKSNNCTISHQPLKSPVVVCAMGNLYNKDALIEYLLSKQKFPHFSHLSGLKDVQTVQLAWTQEETINRQQEESKEGTAHATVASTDPSTSGKALYVCPILELPANGANKFIALQPCGCVISERAWKSVGVGAGEAPTCLVCSKPVTIDSPSEPSSSASSTAAPPSPFHHPSYITLCPGPEESLYLRGVLAERMKQRDAEKTRAKAAKKAAEKLISATGSVASASSSAMVDVNPPTASASTDSNKRKAEDQSVVQASSASAHAAKKQVVALARTGNVLADSVRAITEAAAASVAEHKKTSSTYKSMFLTPEQIAAARFDSISTKPQSAMSML